MLHKQGNLQAVVALLVVFLHGHALLAGELALRSASLPDARAVLTQADLSIVNDRPSVRIHKGIVLPSQRFVFKVDPNKPRVALEEKLPLATDPPLLLRRDVDGDYFLKTSKGDTWLLATELGLNSQTLSLSGNRTYALAFPWSMVHIVNPKKFRPKGQSALRRYILYFRSQSVRTGSLAGTAISFYDANTNGTYEMGVDGWATDTLGECAVFAPVRKFVSTEKGVFKLERLASDGSTAVLSQQDSPTGTLSFQFNTEHGAEYYLAFASQDGHSSFVVSSRGALTRKVLPGSYSLLYGLVYNPKMHSVDGHIFNRAPRVVATIMPGEMSPIKIAANKTASIRFGELTLKIPVTTSTKEPTAFVNIGSKYKIVGAAGERYFAEKPYPLKARFAIGKNVVCDGFVRMDLRKNRYHRILASRRIKPHSVTTISFRGPATLDLSVRIPWLGEARLSQTIETGVDLRPIYAEVKKQDFHAARKLLDSLKDEHGDSPGYKLRKVYLDMLEASVGFELSKEGQELARLESTARAFIIKGAWGPAGIAYTQLNEKMSAHQKGNTAYAKSRAFKSRKSRMPELDAKIRPNIAPPEKILAGLLMTYTAKQYGHNRYFPAVVVPSVDWSGQPSQIKIATPDMILRYNGLLEIDKAGEHELSIEYNDKVEIFVDQKAYRLKNFKTRRKGKMKREPFLDTVKLNLTKGRHLLEIKYTGSVKLKPLLHLKWKTPGTPAESPAVLVPANVLNHLKPLPKPAKKKKPAPAKKKPKKKKPPPAKKKQTKASTK